MLIYLACILRYVNNKMAICVPTGFAPREKGNYLKLLDPTPKFREFGVLFCLQNKNGSRSHVWNLRKDKF